ncbi:VTC domain-containing protein [Halosquirtibacter laminarini]|uniref:VTC domain-containing protein n=1 Tax=Halosquirtibacter laminarini TaxID=3374600 RepID=A0AC61NM07_9BACT|nr:VTC domain-containing protein [Prolixibacteraceae bacterium]
MIENIIQELDFRIVTLKELKKKPSFMSRNDKKFIVPETMLPSILTYLQRSFQILSVDGKKIQTYKNVYYDTDNLRCAKDHFRGKRPRLKFRKRNYLLTGESFWEIKRKSARGRMEKSREVVEGEVDGCPDFFSVAKDNEKLFCSLVNRYLRSSFYDFTSCEKVTIDLDLSIYDDGRFISLLKGFAIVEVKGEHFLQSMFCRFLKERAIYPINFSKYCYGIGTLNPNLFPEKRKMITRYLNKKNRNYE